MTEKSFCPWKRRTSHTQHCNKKKPKKLFAHTLCLGQCVCFDWPGVCVSWVNEYSQVLRVQLQARAAETWVKPETTSALPLSSKNRTLFLVQNLIRVAFCQRTLPSPRNTECCDIHSIKFMGEEGLREGRGEWGYMLVKLAHEKGVSRANPSSWQSPPPLPARHVM